MDATNMVGQFVAMRVIERFNPVQMFRAGLLISALVFIIYGLTRHYLWIVPVQLLLAVSWASLMIGSLSYLLRRRSERGTVSGLLNSTISLSGSVGPFLGGAVSQIGGYSAIMYTGAGITLLGFLFTRGLRTGESTQTTGSHLSDPILNI
jgi:predicted MFS family arabinose efflux permease